MEESDIKFNVMVSLFNWTQKSKSSATKRSKFRKFLDAFCREPGDYFSAIRLILPVLDRERGSYGLKEHALATCLIDALGMSRDSPDAQRLLNWRKGGPKTGSSAGNFSLVASEVLQRRQGLTSGGLTLKELNEQLDRLSSSENRAEKTSVLSDLIRRTNAQEMKWIIMIILKDLKLGISEKSIFHEFHPDAEDLFNVTCDLKLVCEKLRDRSQRHKRQDIEVGKPVRPQLALRVSNASAAWKKLHGKEVVVECKFDGDRIQIHKNNSEIRFFSRSFLDHPEYEHAMSDIIAKNILVDRCILDGEMLVWDTSENRFADFGSNQGIAKAAKEGLDSDRQMCYVAFDILYVGDTSVIHQTLAERHDLLRKVVKSIKGRLEILVPNGGLNASRSPGEPCWSFVARSLDEVEKFFKDTIENRDEGIVLKDLASKWEPSDRSGKWLKLKPEYVRAGSDLDVLIIGGYYGSGRRGGEVSQFLVGLAERPMPNTHPRRFISFCRVGTGLSDEELDIVVTKLKPYFRKYEYPKKAAPSFYQVTNNSKERPDVWIESPEKSVIVSITSDIRTIKSEVFAAPYSLRFPRIDRVRFDKPWHECLDVHTFVELVHSSNGTTQRGEAYGDSQDHKPKRMKSAKKGEKNLSVVPSHFIQTDVSTVKSETLIFAKMMFYFANVPSSHSVDLLHKMVVENGGNFSMNLNNSVTHCIAAESRGIKFQAAKLHGDVIHYSWLLDCCLQKKLLPLQPKYFLYLSERTKRKLEEEIDQFSDSYYVDVDITDLRQLLSNIDRREHPKRIDYYKKKYCPKEEWARFLGCCFYFYFPAQSIINLEWKVLVELALRRLKVAVSFGGGRISDDLSHATHVIVLSGPELTLDFNLLFSRLSAEKHLLLSQGLHVVSSQWLEDCIEKDQKLSEESYSLKPNMQEWVLESELNLDKWSSLDKAEEHNTPVSKEHGTTTIRQATTNKPRVVTLPKKERRTKRGRSSGTKTTRGKTVVNQPRRVRARGGKPAKINEDESDGSGSSANLTFQEESVVQTGNSESGGLIGKQSPTKEHLMIEDSELSQKGKTIEQYPEDQSGDGIRVVEDNGMVSGNRNGTEGNEKLEQMVDPVQAMLMHMIPSLGSSKAKSEDRVIRDETLPIESQKTRGTDPAFADEGSSLDPNPKPEKKRKVSYKDVAGELLKDW
ncbi:DNA ligase 4-like [Coffea arabica]|uniref:DNA ligase n=1 Tax=Coffea arabica TaxID=13443 RepID=A0A6P6SZ84_COFAR